jgi:hypothetical protein
MGKIKTKKSGLRRGEREVAFARPGRATPFGMTLVMSGVKPARATFEPVKPKARKRKAKRRG